MTVSKPVAARIETITASKTLTLSSPVQGFVSAPGAAVSVTLPTTGVRTGYRYRLDVASATETNYVALLASGGAEINRIGGNGFIEVMALQDSPTTAGHWRIVGLRERASGSTALSGCANSPNLAWSIERNFSGFVLAASLSTSPNKDGVAGGVTCQLPARFASSNNAYMNFRGYMNSLAADVAVRITTGGVFEFTAVASSGGATNIPANQTVNGWSGIIYISYV